MQEAIREKINEIESVNIKLKDAQNIAYIGNWEWNLSSNRLICSSELFKIFSITAENFSGAMKDFLILIHPIDRNRIKRLMAEILRKNLDKFEEGTRGIFLVKKSMLGVEMKELAEEVKKIIL